ncbi:Dolichyl-diphosphooligosaccharide--protein glycosyltransferase subunit stt3b, partial [Linnemannia schmuckeri]
MVLDQSSDLSAGSRHQPETVATRKVQDDFTPPSTIISWTNNKRCTFGRRGGFGRGRGRGGDRGRGRGRGRGGKDEKETWTPVTKLGRLVKDRKIQSIEQIYLFSLPIKEYQIVDYFLPSLKDE